MADDELLTEIMDRYFQEWCDPEEQKALREDGSFFWRITHEANEVQVHGAMPLLCWVPDAEHLPAIRRQDDLQIELELECWDIDVPHIRLLPSAVLEALETCERKTGVCSKSIPLDSPDVFRAIISGPSGDELTGIKAACLLAGSRKTKRFLDMCDALDVHDVGSLCRALSLNHGTGIWIDNQDKLYQEGRIIAEQIITCREDVYRYLTARGASPEEAMSFVKRVRMGKIKGRGFTETDLTLLKRCEAEEWFISVCQKVDYLFPESHSIAYAILMIRLVWYVLHYPNVTDSLMIDTAMQLLQE